MITLLKVERLLIACPLQFRGGCADTKQTRSGDNAQDVFTHSILRLCLDLGDLGGAGVVAAPVTGAGRPRSGPCCGRPPRPATPPGEWRQGLRSEIGRLAMVAVDDPRLVGSCEIHCCIGQYHL